VLAPPSAVTTQVLSPPSALTTTIHYLCRPMCHSVTRTRGRTKVWWKVQL